MSDLKNRSRTNSDIIFQVWKVNQCRHILFFCFLFDHLVILQYTMEEPIMIVAYSAKKVQIRQLFDGSMPL